jgi:hypothetical protein
LGAIESGFEEFGEVTDRKTRAGLLDEGLDILAGLWRGQPFNYKGKHYTIKESRFPHPAPPPVQQPRIPSWVVGAWPRMKSMQRVIRWDGLLPTKMDDQGQHSPLTPDDIRAMKAYCDAHRTQTTPFDIVVEGVTSGQSPQARFAALQPWIEAGITWHLDSMWDTPRRELESVRARLRRGPPRASSPRREKRAGAGR